DAFAYFRHEGAHAVVCEQKHMGSRAVVIVCRDEAAAQERFGVLDEGIRSEEHTSELQSRGHLVCRLLLEKNKLHFSKLFLILISLLGTLCLIFSFHSTSPALILTLSLHDALPISTRSRISATKARTRWCASRSTWDRAPL